MKATKLNKIVFYLKIATWIFILATGFTFYLSFRVSDIEERQFYTYVCVGLLTVGYLMNFLSKKLPNFIKTEDEE